MSSAPGISQSLFHAYRDRKILPQETSPQRSGSECSEIQDVALAILFAHTSVPAHSKGGVSTQDKLTDM